MIRRRAKRNKSLVQLIGWSVLVCIVVGGLINYSSSTVVVMAEEPPAPVVEPVEVIIEVKYDAAGIERLIRKTFSIDPNTAVAVAKGEGGLVTERQSDYYRNGVREPSFCAFQIHAPSWEAKAIELGYGDYRTNVESCVSMAHYIYRNYGWSQWSAYNNGSYLKYL